MKYILITLLILNNLVFAKGPIERFFNSKEYRNAEDYKAIAIAINHNTGGWVYGWSKNAPSKTAAKNVALKYCWKNMKKFKIKQECRVYAVGDKKIY